ncbi:MAG: FKBP-type peptidyl-prolyl cis-trans isomerase [Candidatus Hydrothermarchaeaceae archaeon]
MVLENGDFVRINYTGKIKESGEVFDTTIEKVAKESNIYDDKLTFKAAPMVIGAGHAIKGLDESLQGMEVGEKKVFDLPPEKAYGPRDPKLVKVIPLKEFKKQGLRPFPGMMFEAEGRTGKVQSVGSGRVRIDFNYGLAGKTLGYEVTVEEKINKTEEKIRLLLEYHLPYADPNDHNIKLKDGKSTITLAEIVKIKKEAILSKHSASADIFRFIDIVNDVEFLEMFKRPKKEKPAETKKEKSKKS